MTRDEKDQIETALREGRDVYYVEGSITYRVEKGQRDFYAADIDTGKFIKILPLSSLKFYSFQMTGAIETSFDESAFYL